MPKKDPTTGEAIISESGNWNVASDFARIKIMNPLEKCEYYQTIAVFGYNSIIEELMYYQVPNDVVRYRGLIRLIKELLRVCENSKFAMKKPGTKDELKKREEELKKIENVLSAVVEVKNNHINRTQELKIIPEKFDKVLGIVVEIKSLINAPLNKNHLIFTDKEEFDPHAYKKAMKERITDRG